MIKSFKNQCQHFMTVLTKRYPITKIEALFWIYFNIFIYNELPKDTIIYDKTIFLEKLQQYKGFYPYAEKFQPIDKAYYGQLYNAILKKYCCNHQESMDIQELEGIYEGLIQQELRLKTGSFYTPEAIGKYMTLKSILFYIDNRINHPSIKLEDYILKKIDTLPIDYALEAIDVMEEIRIIDIACGSGLFLRTALESMQGLLVNLYQLIGKSICSKKLTRQILDKNIFGIDIQKPAGDMCQLLLRMKAQEINRGPIGAEQLNILHGDALKLDFHKVMAFNKLFHIVIGNPPYIGERGNKALFDDIRNHEFGSKYYERKMDYFYFFIYKAYELLEERGVLCYITTNYFVTADGAKKLRSFLKNNFSFRTIINFNTLNLFSDAKGQHNMVFSLEKTTLEKPVVLTNMLDEKISKENLYTLLMNSTAETAKISQEKLFDNKGHILIQSTSEEIDILNKIQQMAEYQLEDLCYVNQGIVSGADRLTANWKEKLGIEDEIGTGIFVLNDKQLEGLNLEEEAIKKYCKAFYKNSHIKKYHTIRDKGLYVLYIDNENLPNIEQYPNLYKHLYKYQDLLKKRREVRKGIRKWYALQWPRKEEIFEGEKIVVPQRALMNTFAYITEPWYASADVYYITKKSQDISLLYLLGILNSSLMYFWLFYRGKRKGQQLELYATPLKGLPICYPDKSPRLKSIESLVKNMMHHHEDAEAYQEIQNEIDMQVFKLYQLKDWEIKKIKNFTKNHRKK